jgi:hypothetical protein
MPDYGHLEIPISDTRYVQAAHFLRDCKTIVEVGGSRLHKFMGRGIWRQFYNIDPFIESSNDMAVRNYAAVHNYAAVRNYAKAIHQFHFPLIVPERDEKRGLCILGMEMYDFQYGVGAGVISVAHIIESIHMFDSVILEFVESNSVSNAQAFMLLNAATSALTMKRTIRLSTQWQHDEQYVQPNDSFGKTREFWVLEKS